MFDFLKKLFLKKKKKKEKNKTNSFKCETNKVTLKKNSTSNSVNQKPSKKQKKKFSKRKIYGFAKTKEIPHKLHPAFYKKTASNEINYVTFTHSAKVNDKKSNKELIAIPLTSNIDPKERGKRKTYIYPKTFVGKRSALGKEEHNYSFTDKDKDIVIKALNTLPKEKIIKTSNSKKKQ